MNFMKVRRKVVIIVSLLALLGLAGCLGFFKLGGGLRTIEPYIPKEGEETRLPVSSLDIDSQTGVEVEVTLVDIASGEQETKLATLGGDTRFRVIVGKEYKLIAKYNNDTETITFIMKPFLSIVVVIKNRQIERIDLWDVSKWTD